jgi:hypothetical protein
MKRLITGLLVVFLLLGMVACAEPAPAPTLAPVTESSRGDVVLAPPAAQEGISFWGGEEEVPPPVIEVPPEPVPTPTPTPAPAPAPASGGDDDYGESWSGERMIIRTGDITLVVSDVANAIEQITGLAESYEGYVVSSNSWRERDRMIGNIAIRVDAQYFDDAIRSLRQMAVEVTQESTSGKDVTEEYVDLSARLHNLEASEEQLLELMKQAGEVKEILEVQRELTSTRGEIEQIKGRMQYLEQSSSMSLIQIRLEQSKLTVEFSANKRSVKAGERIRFDPEIGGGFAPYSFEWDFGDGSTSTDERPTHAYKSDGYYTVTLKVTDDRGNWDSQERENYIEVLPGWSAGTTASSAWNGLAAFGRVLADFFIWLGYFSPLWIVIGVILYFTWWRRRKKRT